MHKKIQKKSLFNCNHDNNPHVFICGAILFAYKRQSCAAEVSWLQVSQGYICVYSDKYLKGQY